MRLHSRISGHLLTLVLALAIAESAAIAPCPRGRAESCALDRLIAGAGPSASGGEAAPGVSKPRPGQVASPREIPERAPRAAALPYTRGSRRTTPLAADTVIASSGGVRWDPSCSRARRRPASLPR
jgi:hypothetical protein